MARRTRASSSSSAERWRLATHQQVDHSAHTSSSERSRGRLGERGAVGGVEVRQVGGPGSRTSARRRRWGRRRRPVAPSRPAPGRPARARGARSPRCRRGGRRGAPPRRPPSRPDRRGPRRGRPATPAPGGWRPGAGWPARRRWCDRPGWPPRAGPGPAPRGSHSTMPRGSSPPVAVWSRAARAAMVAASTGGASGSVGISRQAVTHQPSMGAGPARRRAAGTPASASRVAMAASWRGPVVPPGTAKVRTFDAGKRTTWRVAARRTSAPVASSPKVAASTSMSGGAGAGATSGPAPITPPVGRRPSRRRWRRARAG